MRENQNQNPYVERYYYYYYYLRLQVESIIEDVEMVLRLHTP